MLLPWIFFERYGAVKIRERFFDFGRRERVSYTLGIGVFDYSSPVIHPMSWSKPWFKIGDCWVHKKWADGEYGYAIGLWFEIVRPRTV